MQFTRSSTALVFGLAASLVSAQVNLPSGGVPTSVYPKLSSDLASFATGQPTPSPSLLSEILEVGETINPTVNAIFATDVPIEQYASGLNEIITGTPTWFQGIPTDVQSYLKSAVAAEASIINKDVNAANGKTEGALRAAIVGVVGVAVGLVMVL